MATHGWEWEGHKFDKPIVAWAIGITTESTKNVLQLELMGTRDYRNADEMGTGSIPRCFMDIENMDRDKGFIRSIRIKHHDENGEFDGWSSLAFKSTQQGTQVLMGSAIDYAWADEEDKHESLQIFSQLTTRTATTGGRVLITATPENGYSALIKKFYDTDDLFIFHAGWNQCPHLDEETKRNLLATYSDWEISMRFF